MLGCVFFASARWSPVTPAPSRYGFRVRIWTKPFVGLRQACLPCRSRGTFTRGKSLGLASAERAHYATGVLCAAANDLKHAAGLCSFVPVKATAKLRCGA